MQDRHQLTTTRWQQPDEVLAIDSNETERLRWRANIGEIWERGLTPYRQSPAVHLECARTSSPLAMIGAKTSLLFLLHNACGPDLILADELMIKVRLKALVAVHFANDSGSVAPIGTQECEHDVFQEFGRKFPSLEVLRIGSASGIVCYGMIPNEHVMGCRLSWICTQNELMAPLDKFLAFAQGWPKTQLRM